MSDKLRIKTRCPLCRAKYRVPAAAVGHRARCVRCTATFRVAEIEPRRATVPTEDDIVQWLNEGIDEEVLAPRPRVVSAELESVPAPPEEVDRSAPETPPEEVDRSAPETPAEETQSPTPLPKSIAHLRPVLPDKSTMLRKTG